MDVSKVPLFKQLEQKTGFCIYFADPYSAWQRGCDENTNGLIIDDITNSDRVVMLVKVP